MCMLRIKYVCFQKRLKRWRGFPPAGTNMSLVNTVQTLAFNMTLVWSMCLRPCLKHVLSQIAFLGDDRSTKQRWQGVGSSAKTTQLLIQWTLVTFCHHPVILGLWSQLWRDLRHWRTMVWSSFQKVSLSAQLGAVPCMKHATPCQSLCASHYATTYITDFMCGFCYCTEICWGSSPNAMLWFQKSTTSLRSQESNQHRRHGQSMPGEKYTTQVPRGSQGRENPSDLWICI